MAGVEGRSEYGGGGVMPNTVYPKGTEALTASDKLRLLSITGQTEDSRAKPDPGFWLGNNYFDPNEKPVPDSQRILRERELARREQQRYKETPR